MECGKNCKPGFIFFLMELPIDHKDLDTIISALSLGGDTRLYFVLKDVRDEYRLNDVWEDTAVECDI